MSYCAERNLSMADYYISQIYPSDKRANDEVDALLISEGIRRDANLDYTCGMYDDEMHIIATGSCFGNTLRCFAVSHEHQGEGLMNFSFQEGIHTFFFTPNVILPSSSVILDSMKLPGSMDRLSSWKTEKPDFRIICVLLQKIHFQKD